MKQNECIVLEFEILQIFFITSNMKCKLICNLISLHVERNATKLIAVRNAEATIPLLLLPAVYFTLT